MVSGFHRDISLNNTMHDNLAFKKKNVRIDWRKIAGIDLDRVARELDVSVLQDNIDHITFCNIESEIDTRTIDPNYIKLFKISQFTIEYLMHSQTYLTDVISTIETQLNSTQIQNEELKKQNEKMNKELIEVKKENKKRKKMIETQQTLMTVTSSNYHQCAYCSKVFLNMSYLQAHMNRRHSELNQNMNIKQTSEFEKELERIKERLRITESELMMERSSRLGLVQNQKVLPSPEVDQSALLKQIETMKSNELKQQKEDFKKIEKSLKKEINELNEKNAKFENEIKSLQEKLGKQSHIGWIKDDVDLEKDNVLKMKTEIDKLKEIISNYEKEVKKLQEKKMKLKSKEENMREKLTKELKEKEEEIQRLKSKLAELENSIGKSDNELQIRIQELQESLEAEQNMRIKLENELKNRPPVITPRATGQQNPPEPKISAPPVHSSKKHSHQQNQHHHHHNPNIYLPEYCPLTKKELGKNPNHLNKYRKFVLDLFEKELDEFGISPDDKGLSPADFKQKMTAIKNFRKERTNDMIKFNELRSVFAEISTKHSQQKLASSLRSSLGNRVTFKNEISSKDYEYDYKTETTDRPAHNNNNEQSEETDDDVSLSNALESDDDTEPTKSILNETGHSDKKTWKDRNSNSPRKASKFSGNLNPDEISDLESISQLLSDRSGSRKKSLNKSTHQNSNVNNNNNNKNSTSVNELKKKLEKQFDNSAKRGSKPSPNAVPIGFQMSKSNVNKNVDDEESFASVSDLENEQKNHRPRSGVRSSLNEYSNSSSVWIPESHSIDINHHMHQHERPPTANSSKTLNFDSDDIENLE